MFIFFQILLHLQNNWLIVAIKQVWNRQFFLFQMMNREQKKRYVAADDANWNLIMKSRLKYTWDVPLLFFSIPEIISNVHSFMYGRISKCGFATSLSKFSSKIRIFSLNIGINVCKTFKLNDGFISRRIGRHTADARFNGNLNVVFSFLRFLVAFHRVFWYKELFAWLFEWWSFNQCLLLNKKFLYHGSGYK